MKILIRKLLNKNYLFSVFLLIILIIINLFLKLNNEIKVINDYDQFNKHQKYLVKVDKVIDGDTLWVSFDEYQFKIRLLAIDAPEYTEKIEKYGKEATIYVSDLIKKANKIEIEFDNGLNKDRYNRALVYLWVDDNLLNADILKKGLAKIKYLKKDNTKYLKRMQDAENYAKTKKINLWSQ